MNTGQKFHELLVNRKFIIRLDFLAHAAIHTSEALESLTALLAIIPVWEAESKTTIGCLFDEPRGLADLFTDTKLWNRLTIHDQHRAILKRETNR